MSTLTECALELLLLMYERLLNLLAHYSQYWNEHHDPFGAPYEPDQT